MLATNPLAQTGLAFNLNGVDGQISKKVVLKGWHSYRMAHIVANLALCACLLPNADIIHTTVPLLIVAAVAEVKVAKGGESRIALRGNLSLLITIDIKRHFITLDDDGDMIPAGCAAEYVAHIHTVGTVVIPTHRNGTILIVMEEELTPTWTYLVAVAHVLGTSHIEFDGGFVQCLVDDIGDSESALFHHDAIVDLVVGYQGADAV